MKKDSTWKIKLERIKRSKLWAGDMARIAVRILNFLEDNRKSQKWLADQLGVSPQQVNKIVKGKQNMSWGKIKEIENVLGIKLVQIQEEFCGFGDIELKPNFALMAGSSRIVEVEYFPPKTGVLIKSSQKAWSRSSPFKVGITNEINNTDYLFDPSKLIYHEV